MPSVTKAQEFRAPRSISATLRAAREDSRAETQESRADTKNRVLVIMDDAIFRKQAYPRTGSQKDSIPEVTDSIQRSTSPRFILVSRALVSRNLSYAANSVR